MIKNGWYCCPHCGKKFFKVDDKCVIKGVQYKCKECKRIINIEIKEP